MLRPSEPVETRKRRTKMITRWAPERLHSFERFSKMMEDVFGGTNEVWTPVVDVKETPGEIVFVAELPGMQMKDVEVEFNGDILTIRGTREFHQEDNKEDYVRLERSYGTFLRSFTIDGSVKPEAIHASFQNGLLTVTLPKAANRPSRKIPIKG